MKKKPIVPLHDAVVTYFLLDEKDAFLAVMTPRFAIIRSGYEAEDERIRKLSAEYAGRRFKTIQKKVARNFDGPVRIKNVHIFDPATQALTEAVSVIIVGNKIDEIIPFQTPPNGSEVDIASVEIDGAGGTLIAGMYEMHGHLGQNSALLNIAAGVTSLRDMGNNNEVLSELIKKIESGRLVGPRIIRRLSQRSTRWSRGMSRLI